MSHPIKRLLFTILIAAAFLGIYAGVMYRIGQRHSEELIVKHNQRRTEGIRGILDQLENQEEEAGEAFCDVLETEVRLKTIELAAEIKNGQYSGTRLFNDAMVVRCAGGRADTPREAAGMFPGLSSEVIENEYAQTRVVKETGEGAPLEVILTSGRIADDWFYVRWTPASEYDEHIRASVDKIQLLNKMAAEYGGEMFLIAADEEDPEGAAKTGEEGTILFSTDGLSDYASIADLGVTQKDLGKESFELTLRQKGTYICIPVKLQSGQCFVCCYSLAEERAGFNGNVITQILFALALLTGLITWCYSVAWMVVTKELREDQLGQYTPAAVKKKTARLGGAYVLLMFIVAFLTVAMQFMYEEDSTGSTALGILARQLEEGEQAAEGPEETDAAKYVEYGEKIAGILTRHPELLDEDHLSQMSRTISADYLIVFDENGDETACSEAYSGFSLGTAAAEPSADFRRLLKGIPFIIHGEERDFITGENRQTVGVRYELPAAEAADDTLPAGSKRYGAILIALPGAAKEGNADLAARKQAIYKMMVSEGEMIIEINPESQMIESCSREEYKGAGAGVVGIGKESLADCHMDFFRIDREWYFGISRMIDGNIFYYLADNTEMLLIGAAFALLTAILFLIGYGLVAWYALHDYTYENYAKYTTVMREISQKTHEKMDQNGSPVNYLVVKWDEMAPERKAKRVLQIELVVFMATLLLIALSDSPIANYSALTFVIEGNWTKGINIFGIVAVILVVCIEYLIYLIIKIIFSLLYGIMDAKEETVARLIRSLINYLLIAVAACMSLNYFGADTTTMIASIGLLSLAISLGAKDIVADILSGISLVFEGTFNVGDYVEISGFRGRVMEIGVRSTKLLNDNNDVKTINNHDISNVVNLSKHTSYCWVKFRVRTKNSLKDIEAMLERELPAFKDQIPNLVSGPTYAGVIDIDDGITTLGIVAEAREEDVLSVQNELNKAVRTLYERKMLYPTKEVSNRITLRFDEGNPGVVRMRREQEEENKEENRELNKEQKNSAEGEKKGHGTDV
ncbi:MAG: mechanosensitive ion channel [Eubacteriales bacterium]|nr:mechanosensitive ion channel [Eubacteriales bacterium]